MSLKKVAALCCVFALPCLGIAGLLVHLAAAPVPSVLPVDPEVAVFDFGAARVGDVVEHVFPLRNAGRVALVVEDVELSCECLSLAEKPVHIAPGAEFDLALRLLPDTEGDFEYTAAVRFADRNVAPRRFALMGHVSPAIVRSDYITAKALRRLMEKDKRLSVVDLRGHNAYSRAHVANAMSIPVGALPHKSWLKPRTVVLVDDGTGGQAAVQLCRELRQAGFVSVSILDGGMDSWYALGGAVDGNPTLKSSQVTSVSRAGATRTPTAVVSFVEDRRVVRTHSTRKKGCGGCP